MAYLDIRDFRYGMDRRRERVAGTPGTLWTLENGHITRGGDIENCLRFVPRYTLPAGTHGCYALNRQLYVFGSADLAATVPLGTLYQRLQSPDGGAMTRVVDVKGFAGKLYVIADFDDGGRFHFYNGARVTDWDAIATAAADFTSLAHFLAERVGGDSAIAATATDNVITIEALVPGVPFTISAAAANNGGTNDQTAVVATPQPNVVAVAEVQASFAITVTGGSNGTVSSVLAGGTELMNRAVTWNASDGVTAERIAQSINSRSTITGYLAMAAGGVVTVSAAPGTGATPNGTAVTLTTDGDIAISADDVLAGGVTAVDAVAQVSTVTFGGTLDAGDLFTVTLNDVDYVATLMASGMGRSLYVDFQRVWSPAGSLLRYCKLSDPTVWNPAAEGSDAGFINVAEDAEGSQNIVVVQRYSAYAAVYCETCTVLYTLDTDPENFSKFMVVDNITTTAPRSAIRYGNNDVFHLDPTGIRSMRALNYTNAPYVDDVGNALDPFLLAYADSLTECQRRSAVAIIEPKNGRFWMALGDRIFVLSFFPGGKISAWSYYATGFPVSDFAKIDRRVYARSGDTIYLYGGLSGAEQPGDDELVTTVELPFLGANAPATRKGLYGFDAALANEWAVEALPDPNREDKMIPIGVVRGTTYNAGDIALPGQAQLVALKFICRRRGRRAISMAQIHFEKQDSA